MYTFHKPRTYRSTEGCCICKAKSSSSRFVDSRKYERDIMQCFDLKDPRQGEICNACVLLVKRFKRLPVGSKRNWGHVVDAKAGIGPGCTKIQTKYKSERISSRAALANNALHISNSQSASSSRSSSLGEGGIATTNNVNGMSSYIPEKFTKILKKTKKIRDSSSSSSGQSTKRKSTNNGWSQSGLQSMPTTPESLDSDYDDARIHGSLAGSQSGGSGTVVQFQTQTRASAYRAQAAAEARKRLVKMGTKRRKLLLPRKNRRSVAQEESVEFFDEEEWQERKSCCGMLYECAALGGALLIDTANYKPCEQHRQKASASQNDLTATATTTTKTATAAENKAATTVMPLQKTIIQTMPAVVQLQPPPAQATSAVTTSSTSCLTTHTTNCNLKSTATTTSSMPTPTPVLKKHHLFFKRQSECFPQGDMVTNTQNTTNNDTNSSTTSTTTAHIVNKSKTESEFNVPILHQQQQQHQYNYSQICKSSGSSTSTLQRHNENNSSVSSTTTILTNPLSTLSISVASSSSSSSTTMPQMPKHSLAKVTTISPTLMSTSSTTITNSTSYITSTNNTAALSLTKPNGFLHKIKAADTGKIVKNSFEKLNTSVRLKTSDLHDMKPIIKTVDKSYILTKPSTPPTQVITLNVTTSNTTTTTTTAAAAAAAVAASQYQSLAAYNATAQQQQQQQQPQSALTTAPPSAASPTSSTSSTSSSTKFNDNSSDSGFDENLLDRKSVSPSQEDYDKKVLTRPGVQTMFLASGVQIQGQPQNLILTGNEMAAKILQNRKYGVSSLASSNITSNPRSNHHSAVKIAQISTNPLTAAASSSSTSSSSSSSMSLAAQAKMRAIYNNNNTIQHENGITTIVPASSLAASTQTAAMQNIAPSTVTITPAPPVGAATQFNTQNVIARKLTTANIINLQSNNSHNNQLFHPQHQHQHHHSNNTSVSSSTAANQKIILLKTSNNSTTNYNHLHTTTTLSGVGGHGSGGGGLGITR